MDELKEISDRVTVMRDGEYVGTLRTASTPVDTIISMMVGRSLTETKTDVPDLPKHEVILEVRNLRRASAIRDVSFSLRKGEILGFAGLMGAGRTEVARAIFGVIVIAHRMSSHPGIGSSPVSPGARIMLPLRYSAGAGAAEAPPALYVV